MPPAEFRTAWQGLKDSLMDQITNPENLERERLDEPVAQPRQWRWKVGAIGVGVAAGGVLPRAAPPPPPANTGVGAPAPPPPAPACRPRARAGAGLGRPPPPISARPRRAA